MVARLTLALALATSGCGRVGFDALGDAALGDGMPGDGAGDATPDSTPRTTSYVKSPAPDPDDLFGTAVAVSADGSTLAVGVPLEDSIARGVDVGDPADNTATDSGAVFVFRRVGDQWVREAYLKSSNADPGDYFGISLALSADGARLVVGAVNEASLTTGVNGDETNNDGVTAGAAYVFQRAGSTWMQEAYLKASNTDGLDQFGISVAIAGDGLTVAVGALTEDSSAMGVGGDQTDNTFTDAGAVYVFQRGAMWQPAAYIKASNPDFGDGFGNSVALSFDGSVLAIGAGAEDGASMGVNGPQIEGSNGAGAAYVFRRGSSWVQEAYVKASHPATSDSFGDAVALSGDGTTLVVGATGEDGALGGIDADDQDDSSNDTGAVYVFEYTDLWQQRTIVKAPVPAALDSFGGVGALAVTPDGSRIVIGAYRRDAQTGAAFVVDRAGTSWIYARMLGASNAEPFDRYGCAVAAGNDGALAVAACREASATMDPANNAAPGAGAVYVE